MSAIDEDVLFFDQYAWDEVINPMTLDEVKQWIDALESGQYQQGIGALRSGDKFCCLGVEEHIHPKQCELVTESDMLFHEEASQLASRYVRLPAELQIELSGMNDDAKPFKKIAQELRRIWRIT